MNSKYIPVEVIVICEGVSAGAAMQPSQSVRDCIGRLGLAIHPLHPLTADPDLAKYFVAQLNPAAVDTAIEQLLRCDGVEGAYAKPQGEAP